MLAGRICNMVAHVRAVGPLDALVVADTHSSIGLLETDLAEWDRHRSHRSPMLRDRSQFRSSPGWLCSRGSGDQ
jgi:hypothetical protein